MCQFWWVVFSNNRPFFNIQWMLAIYVELGRIAFQVYCILLLFFIDHAKAIDWVDHNKLWKIIKGMGIPDHLTCLLRHLYVGQKETVRT